MSITPSQLEKIEMIDNRNNFIILCLKYNVMRDIAKEKIVTAMQTRLELLYMTKSLAYMLCLKQQIQSFRMVESISILEKLMELRKKIIDDLVNIEVNLDDEDKT